MSAPLQPRIVRQYQGCQIVDAHERILITFDAKPKRGVAGALNNRNYVRAKSTGIWSRKHSPAAIMDAQEVLNTHYEEQA